MDIDIIQNENVDYNPPKVGKIFTLSFAHLLNDWYSNYIQSLLPFMIAAGLSISKGAFLVSAFTLTSSILQPVFGYLVDQKDQRWMVYVGTLWMAILLGMVGLIGAYPLLFITVALAGLGTAAFHPQASAMVSAVSGNRRGFFQAIFVTIGNVGLAFTPLMVVPFVEEFGMKATPIFIIPGVIVSILLWISAPKMPPSEKTNRPALSRVIKGSIKSIMKVLNVVIIRSLAYFGLVAFLPLYLQEKDISMTFSSYLIFLMLFSGALGGLLGGHLSDKIGRKPVVAGSLLLATPMFYLFLNTPAPYSYIFLALAGATLLSSFSITVVIAQEIMSKNAAMASGMMLGFGIGIGGLGVGLMGIVAELTSVDFVINLLVTLPVFAGLMALFIKEKRQVA